MRMIARASAYIFMPQITTAPPQKVTDCKMILKGISLPNATSSLNKNTLNIYI
jgi:hypothetical protein